MSAILPRGPGWQDRQRDEGVKILDYVREHPGATTPEIADEVLHSRTASAYNRAQKVLLRFAAEGLVRRDMKSKPHTWHSLEEPSAQADRALLQRCVDMLVGLAHGTDDDCLGLLEDLERVGVRARNPATGARMSMQELADLLRSESACTISLSPAGHCKDVTSEKRGATHPGRSAPALSLEDRS